MTRPVKMLAVSSGIARYPPARSHAGAEVERRRASLGGNQGGQLGNGSTAPVTGPVQVTGLTATTQVAAGGQSFSLAVHTVPYLVGL